MTKREREQVVELLRCAADIIARGGWDEGGVLSLAATAADSPFFKFAYDAERRVWSDMLLCGVPEGALRLRSLLEAAARVEEGSWP
jgi:hypothetical protein